MKQFYRILGTAVILFFIQNSYSQQTVILHIPQALETDAGNSITIDQFDQVTLGGSPTAQFGLPPYQYSWTPITGLNDPASSNPIASPEDTITYSLVVTDANGCSVSNDITINVITIGIDDVSNKYDISIYPNPNSGIVNIDFHQFSGDILISCIDFNGKLIEEQKVYIEEGSSESFDLRKHPSGSYVLQFRGKDFFVTRTIIKK